MSWYIEHVPSWARFAITLCVLLLIILFIRNNKKKVRRILKKGDRVRLRNGVGAEVLDHPTQDILEVRLENGNGTYVLLNSVDPVSEKKNKKK